MAAALADVFPPRRGRVHEVSGPGATAFAAIVAAGHPGAVLWVRAAWQAAQVNPLGLSAFFDPARLLMAQASDLTDGLAVAEEALRDGAAPLVVIEVTQPLSLTAGRRLQLAAKAGRSTGLCLIGQDMGSNAAETRWLAAPLADRTEAQAPVMRWQLIKNKSGTVGAWDLRWDMAARRLDVVPPRP